MEIEGSAEGLCVTQFPVLNQGVTLKAVKGVVYWQLRPEILLGICLWLKGSCCAWSCMTFSGEVHNRSLDNKNNFQAQLSCSNDPTQRHLWRDMPAQTIPIGLYETSVVIPSWLDLLSSVPGSSCFTPVNPLYASLSLSLRWERNIGLAYNF